MRHNNTKTMLTHWMALLAENNETISTATRPQWPERGDIQPATFRDILGDMFILELDASQATYRLAGTRLCAMFGKEMKQHGFTSTFNPIDQQSAENWTNAMGRDAYLSLICTTGRTACGKLVNLETLLMPLSHNGAYDERALGITSAIDAPEWLGAIPIVEQSIRSVRIVRPWETDTYRANWPFLEPQPHDLKSERQPVHQSPGLYANLPENSDLYAEFAPQEGRQIGHLRVIEGGKQDIR